MPETMHTPEPWTQGKDINRYTIYGTDASILASTRYRTGFYPDTSAECEADAARIVACVNGCAGINPEAVPPMLAALADPCMLPALEALAKGRNANAVRCLDNARKALALAHYLAM